MSILILNVGQSLHPLSGKYSSAAFEAAVVSCMNSGIADPGMKPIDPNGRPVYIGEGMPAAETARLRFLNPAPVVDPLLNEVPLRPYTDTEKELPVDTWLRKAAGQRKKKDPRQPESRDAVIARGDRLIAGLKDNCILITYPVFLSELLDRLRIHNYVIQRSGIIRIQPLEMVVVSEKDAHCGGCGHNCFLSNPGCGVGRDKAMRKVGPADAAFHWNRPV